MQDDVVDLLKKIDVPAAAGSGKINVYYLGKRGRRKRCPRSSPPSRRSDRRRRDPAPVPGARPAPATGRGRRIRRARGRREGHGGQGHQLPDHRRVVERLRNAGGGHQEARHPSPPGVRRGGDHGDRPRQDAGRRGGVARRGAGGEGTAARSSGARTSASGRPERPAGRARRGEPPRPSRVPGWSPAGSAEA